MPRSTPGRRLQQGRLKQRKRQEDVAKEIHKSVATYKSWEQDRTRPRTFSDIISVCSAAGISVQDFVEGKESQQKLPAIQERLLSLFNEFSEETQQRILDMLEGMVQDIKKR